MNRILWLAILGLAGLSATASQAQPRPYIGYVYPAGGQQGTTFQIKLGGQRLDDVNDVLVSGTGVSAKVVRYYRRLNNQEIGLLKEQLKELKPPEKGKTKKGEAKKVEAKKVEPKQDKATLELIERIEKRIAGWVNKPACAAISNIVLVEVAAAPDAKPGSREIRLVTQRGVTNPLVFHVGQVPEVARKPMKTCFVPILGREQQALRKRPPDEVEARVTVPCTMNGQIAAREVNRYRFEASKGQRLVISTAARELIPYIADAVPGWFQPVLTLRNAAGKELAYNDDYRFNPDPTILFEVPEDGEFVLAINDSIYRGREDFIYRITIGELPFVTSIFPLGARVGAAAEIEMEGWNLEAARLTLPPKDAGPAVYRITAKKEGFVSNSVPFALDSLPECFDKESNNDPSHAQKVKLPTIVNGRMDRPGDWDVFQIEGRAGDTIVAEVYARRLESPMDSMLKLTDAAGKLLAFNDDHRDPESGLNTHHADSYLVVELPADGTYYIHLGDTARHGGEAYAYRLRIGAPQPDFALRMSPSSGVARSKAGLTENVYVVRKDGFTGPVKLSLKNPPPGFPPRTVVLPADKDMVKFWMKTNLVATDKPVNLVIEGRAIIDGREVVHEAMPAEDQMQAFLWRHLVPAADLKVVVYDPSAKPAPKRVRPAVPVEENPPAESGDAAAESDGVTAEKPKLTKQQQRQLTGRLRQIYRLFAEGLFTDDFYGRKVAESKASLLELPTSLGGCRQDDLFRQPE